jgi:anaphase-promoting complex subunit 4
LSATASCFGRASRLVSNVRRLLQLIIRPTHCRRQHFDAFQLSDSDLTVCLDLTGRAVVIASWLASVARRELIRFREFISWLRFGEQKAVHMFLYTNLQRPETSVIANPNNNDNAPGPKHDLLEVNHYFMSGLVVSSIDKWFMGPVPSFSPRELGLPGDTYGSITDVLEKARSVLSTPGQIVWQAVRNIHLQFPFGF